MANSLRLKHTLNIADLCYQVSFEQAEFSFALLQRPRRLQNINYKRHPALALFRDDPLYEDLALNLPALQILNAIADYWVKMIYRHQISYFSFSATSVKKARVYAALLQRYRQRYQLNLRYDQHGLQFLVYVDFNHAHKA